MGIFEERMEEIKSLRIVNDLQVAAIARDLELYDGWFTGELYESMERFKKAAREAFENGCIDLNDIEKNTFDLDYFNNELKNFFSSMYHFGVGYGVYYILTFDCQGWRHYQKCFDDGRFDELMMRLRLPAAFNKLAVEVFDDEVKEMNVIGYDNLIEYFRDILANCEDLGKSLYWYNMFALVFTFIYNLEKKGGEEND